METGLPVYHQMDHVDYDELEWLRASASMPLASRVVEVQGRRLLDGGVADSIPLAYFEGQGYSRNVVVLTQPLGYRKSHSRLMPLMLLRFFLPAATSVLRMLVSPTLRITRFYLA